MPLGILSDDELAAELEKLSGKNKSESKTAEVIDIQRGRGSKEETPESARKLIADLAINGVSPTELAQQFGISPSSISAYKHGSTSTASYNNPDVKLKAHTDLVRDRIIKKARKKLISSIDNISEDKLADCKPKELAGVARDMSAVIKNLEPVKENDTATQGAPQFVIYAPQLKQEIDFQTIHVSD